MMRTAALGALAIVALATTACTAIDLDRMESRYETLVRAEAAPAARINRSSDLGTAVLGAGTDELLFDLAKRSRDLAGKADDDATRIALLRLASLSGWQSHTPDGIDLASASADEARRRCNAIDPAKRFRPARDCAIAEIMPMILAAESDMAEIGAPPLAEPATPEQGRQRLALIRKVRSDFVDRLSAWDSTITPAIGKNVSLGQWYRASRRIYACVIKIRLATPLTTTDDALNRELVEAGDALAEAVRAGLQLSSEPNALNAECAAVVASAPVERDWRGAVPAPMPLTT